MEENSNTEATMTNTETTKEKKKAKKPAAKKAAPKKAAATNGDGLPSRPKHSLQIGLRLSEEEREELVGRCKKEGHYSLSNCVRAALGWEALR